MADNSYVLNSALCFLLNKYGQVHLSTLKTTFTDFYGSQDISKAKCQLNEDVEGISTDIKKPRLPRRHDGPDKKLHEVDDIFTLLTFLDENKLASQLPIYVTNNCNDIPSMRLFDGDLRILTGNMEKLTEKLAILEGSLAGITWGIEQVKEAIRATHDKQVELTVAQADRTVHAINSAQSANTANTARVSTGVSVGVGGPVSGGMTSRNSGAFFGPAAGDGSTSWAATMAETSTPVAGSSQAVFQSTTDDDNDNTPFQEVRRRRSAKRANKRPLEQGNNADTVTATPRLKQQPEKSRRILGKASLPGFSKLVAADKIVKKAVFCVDNVDNSCSIADLESYVTTLGVNVVSCYVVDSRRRRNEPEKQYTKRKAFRLCIAASDQEKLLDPEAWPESITIKDWYFKGVTGDKKQRLSTSRTGTTSNVNNDGHETVSAPPPSESNDTITNPSDMEADDTVILMTEHSQPASVLSQ